MMVMAFHGASLFMLLLGTQHIVTEGSTQGFLGKHRSDLESSEIELNGILGEALGLGHGVDQARLDKIRAVLTPVYAVLPKNKLGRVSTSIMRYAVRRYFSSEHAWTLKGFEPYAEDMNVSASITDILQGKLPDTVRSLLEKRFAHQGFALEDVVAMVAAIERLTNDEVISSVETAFVLNGLHKTESLSQSELDEILVSFLLISMFEGTTEKQKHLEDKANVHIRYPHWGTTKLFLQDISGSYNFQRTASSNPFLEPRFVFQDAVRMAEGISEQFGPWSNHECHQMKDVLTDMDVHGTGRVKMSQFYQKAIDGQWQFLEPSSYLRQIGSLDESSAYLGPQLIIPNYITGASNCITSTTYYSICCLNECDLVFQHLEKRIPLSSASKSQILDALDSLPSPPNVTSLLQTRLNDIARINHGSVPMHGRLMAQWLHFVFPHECPYPQVSQTGELAQRENTVTEEEIKSFLESDAGRREPSPDAGMSMWDLQESILEASTPSDYEGSGTAKWLRAAAQIGMAACGVWLVLREFSRLRPQGPKGSKHLV